MWAIVVAAATLGLASTIHCATMCGPLALGVCRGQGRTLGGYLFGRLTSYALMGALFGLVGSRLVSWVGFSSVRIVTGVLVGVLLLRTAYKYAGGGQNVGSANLIALKKLRSTPTNSPFIAWIRRPKIEAIAQVWRKLFGAVTGTLARRSGFSLGLVTAVFPCGALFSALAVATAAAHPLGSALAMVTFALASTPGLVMVVMLGARAAGWLKESSAGRHIVARRTLGVVLSVVAIWMMASPVYAALTVQPGKPACSHCQAHAQGGDAP